jgi:phosphate transport system substrate-binding protein
MSLLRALLAVVLLSAGVPSVASPQATPLLRIQGSNTVGAALAPALVEGLFHQQGFSAITRRPGGQENEQTVLARNAEGAWVQIAVAAHGSSTGFRALRERSAELAASSRPVKDAEVNALAARGDLRSRGSEQVIAIDGLAVIVHPTNPLRSLDVDQLAALFSGELRNWRALGGPDAPVRLYARDDQSGTYDTFKELVLVPQGQQLDAGARRFESNDRLSEAVMADPLGIGFVGLASVGQARALAISAGGAQALLPSPDSVATEDYPLSRRLFLYRAPDDASPWAQALIDYAQSAEGQRIVERVGFIGQAVRAIPVEAHANLPGDYRELAQTGRRLSINFRFQEGSAQLDNKAMRDLERVRDYLNASAGADAQLVLVGFGDAKNDPSRARLLSRLRAETVRRALSRLGVTNSQVLGIGDDLPVADNQAESGRIRNRRVEVWIR